ncbi:NADH-FMN oxidoreductase RutF, flavin reductase (DIM6/NTAB) family [Lentzea waywayandensis]|uniref:NADH-FMN oxidoreductase RutF, flavin reductase (DIM6/NTAB) family n=1 Tax=Lentzea waywayandensis TaxID=84724 RepID=A0A1I6DE04_9PSEU|nr:flavin reductase family protein [Lentzea waywayandensis]SFR03695.1 NADH-FMN oxidoreductase RutF, flavin reductase (DIM6/NTAB) family [Lentzea waywayandensis]
MSTQFRSLMAAYPTGVAVVTAFDRDLRPWGMTVSSLSSVSLDPPTLLVCLRDSSPTLDALTHNGSFTVNLLHHEARSAAELFSSGDPDRFRQVTWEHPESVGGPHLVDDAHAAADCKVDHMHRTGTHVVVFGGVQQVVHRSAAQPLLYGLRQYASWPRIA